MSFLPSWAQRIQEAQLFVRGTLLGLCNYLGVAFLLLAIGGISALSASTQSSPVFHSDDSDWWSKNRVENSKKGVPVQHREPDGSNFLIFDVRLGFDEFTQAATKLGPAAIVERGDGATPRRTRVCYVSAEESEKVYMVYEQGEFDFSFYLFADGADWSGSHLCASSKLVSRRSSTASGLHLGQSPDEVVAILGKPSSTRKNEIMYSFAVTKKSSPDDLKSLQKQHPELTLKEVQEHYGEYDLAEGIHARFVDSKLIYLAVSRVEMQ